MKNSPLLKPAIACLASSDCINSLILKEITLGMEEEETPFWVLLDSSGDSFTMLASKAASTSALKVGVGLSRHGVALGHKLLPAGKPLLKVDTFQLNAASARLFGTNAARLAKGKKLLLYDL